MTDFHLDMGFDWDSLQKPGNAFDGFLQIGLAKVTGNTAQPASFADIDTNDTIEFNLFDLSEAPNNDAKTASISSGWLTFQSADSLTSSPSPVSGSPLTGDSVGASGTGTSAIFSRTPQNTYPMWPINSASGTPLSLSMVNQGNFFFTLQISVTNSAGVTKTFGVDPEMIVKS